MAQLMEYERHWPVRPCGSYFPGALRLRHDGRARMGRPSAGRDSPRSSSASAGAEVIFGIPGGASLAAERRFHRRAPWRRRLPLRAHRTRTGRRFRGGGLRRRLRACGLLHRYLWTRRHQPGHTARRCPARQPSCLALTGNTATTCRARSFPGHRYRRYHRRQGHQALAAPGPTRGGAGDARAGLPCRGNRPAGLGAGRHAQGRAGRHHHHASLGGRCWRTSTGSRRAGRRCRSPRAWRSCWPVPSGRCSMSDMAWSWAAALTWLRELCRRYAATRGHYLAWTWRPAGRRCR